MPGSDLIRKKIRDNVKSLLVAGATGAGTNVFVSRINKSFLEELPGIFIYITNDNPLNTRHFENTFDRTVTLVTEIIVAQKAETGIFYYLIYFYKIPLLLSLIPSEVIRLLVTYN